MTACGASCGSGHARPPFYGPPMRTRLRKTVLPWFVPGTRVRTAARRPTEEPTRPLARPQASARTSMDSDVARTGHPDLATTSERYDLLDLGLFRAPRWTPTA